MFIPIIVIGWLFVALLAALAEATAPNGTALGAIFTFLGWGVIPLSIVVYILATPMRRAKQRAVEAEESAQSAQAPQEEPDHA
jgi:mannose/fructose/N-acetylgalactosamine-specific phosphotransferase system component IID